MSAILSADVRLGAGRHPLAHGAPRRAGLLASLLMGVALVACGGGGGGADTSPIAGPPSTPAALAATAAEANESVKSAIASADVVANKSGTLSGLSALLGAPIGMAPQDITSFKQESALQNLACGDIFDTPCSGSATADTNVDMNAVRIPAGSYFDIRFSSASGKLFGASIMLDGRMRMDFLSEVNANQASPAGLDVKLTLDRLSGSVNGRSFGPISDVSELKIDGSGTATLVGGGYRFNGLSGVSVTDATNYRIASGGVRGSYWGGSGGYVDVSYTNWRMSGGRPTTGSAATIAAGNGNSITVSVTGSTPTTVTYAVAINLGGITKAYVVTATYPAGGGAPTYDAVPG